MCMKNSKQPKKMRLNREAIKRLTPAEAKTVAGGISVGTCTACLETYCACNRSEWRCYQSHWIWDCYP